MAITKAEALARLDTLEDTNYATDYEENLGFETDVLPYIKLAKELGVEDNEKFQSMIKAIKERPVYRNITFRQLDNIRNFLKDQVDNIFKN
jgi:hypothetical protein